MLSPVLRESLIQLSWRWITITCLGECQPSCIIISMTSTRSQRRYMSLGAPVLCSLSLVNRHQGDYKAPVMRWIPWAAPASCSPICHLLLQVSCWDCPLPSQLSTQSERSSIIPHTSCPLGPRASRSLVISSSYRRRPGKSSRPGGNNMARRRQNVTIIFESWLLPKIQVHWCISPLRGKEFSSSTPTKRQEIC